MVVEPKLRYTYRDYLDLPETAERCELIDGEYWIMPSPTGPHQGAVLNMGSELWRFVRANKLGKVFIAPFDVILSPDDVFQPDVMFISNERMRRYTGDNVRGAPDLAVEALSPSTANRDRGVKLERYARFGVLEYWLIDTVAKNVQVLAAIMGEFETAGVYGEGDTLQSPLLPGLQLDVREAFAGF